MNKPFMVCAECYEELIHKGIPLSMVYRNLCMWRHRNHDMPMSDWLMSLSMQLPLKSIRNITKKLEMMGCVVSAEIEDGLISLYHPTGIRENDEITLCCPGLCGKKSGKHSPTINQG